MREAVPEYNLNRKLLQTNTKTTDAALPLDVTLLGGIDRTLPAELLELNGNRICTTPLRSLHNRIGELTTS